ncbi:MAG: hypothetical protein JJE36_02405 [Coriobacteriia bacterium]|nr:hypothetical protein [Coriobacteriia bacterium]
MIREDMSASIQELRKMTDEELICAHDECAKNTSVGVSYYLDELQRRSIERSNRLMNRSTIAIVIMTAVILIATVFNMH